MGSTAQVHQKYDLPSSSIVGKELFRAMIKTNMNSSVRCLFLGLVIEDL